MGPEACRARKPKGRRDPPATFPQVWTFQRHHTRGYSHLAREWPPALAGQTEPSPSSWEVWSPSTSYSRAGKIQSSKKKKRREISCYSLPYKKQFWFCHCSLILPGRKKKGGNLGEKEIMFNMKKCLPLHLQLQPCTYLSHIPNDDANDGAWANLTPARGKTWQIGDSLLLIRTQKHKEVIDHGNTTQLSGTTGQNMVDPRCNSYIVHWICLWIYADRGLCVHWN